jgi:hypothetical protein
MRKAVKRVIATVKSSNVRRHTNSFAPTSARSSGLSKAINKVWSVPGAVAITAVALLISAVQILLAVHGKVVILPFEVRSDQSTPSELGASFAQSLSSALNDYRRLFPSTKLNERPVRTGRNYSDLVQSFMSDLPFVEIPQTSHLSKGATVLEAVKIGPVSIPVSQIVFESLPFFHDDTLRGTLEAWGDSLVARISLGGEKAITVSATKDEGYRALIRRATVELLQEKKWIAPMPMKLSALALFSDGLRDYLDYDTFAEERFLQSAREKYGAALRIDGSADLARLHLGAAQYISTEPAMLAKAIENFSLLLGDPHYGRAAKIGYVASVIRYITREGGCGGVYRFLVPALEVVNTWGASGKPPSAMEELLLWSGTFRLAVGYLLPNQPCSSWVLSISGENDIEKLFGKARAGYQQALTQLAAEPQRYSAADVTRYRFNVLLSQKYLLDDMTDYSILARKPDLGLATAALDLGKQIQLQKQELPEGQRVFFAPSIDGSVADSYLRLAKMKEANAAEAKRLVSAAIDHLRLALKSPEPPTVRWASFRLADLELGRSNASAALEWLINAYSDRPSFPKAFDESYFPFGMLIERSPQRCEAIDVLTRGGAAGSIASKLALIDTLRRHGDRRRASLLAASLRTSIELSTTWLGEAIQQKLSFVEAKLDPDKVGLIDFRPLSEQLRERNPRKEFLKFDLFELAEIIQDEKLLTMLSKEILFPRYQPEIVHANC